MKFEETNTLRLKQALRTWDDRYRRYQGAILKTFMNTLQQLRLPSPPQGTIVDCNTGTGLVLRALRPLFPKAQLIGLDIHPVAVQVARTLSVSQDIQFIQADAHRWPFASDSIDFVVGKSSAAYWDHPDTVLAEIRRCLKPGGAVAFFEPNPRHVLAKGYRRFRFAERFVTRGLPSQGLQDFMDTGTFFDQTPSLYEFSTLLRKGGARGVVSKPTLGGLFSFITCSF